MQDKMDIKDDKDKVKDEVGKLGGDKLEETPKPDLGKKDDEPEKP